MKIPTWIVLAVVYLATSVPVGLSLYSLKSWLGYDVSLRGGFHSFQRCLNRELDLLQGRSSEALLTGSAGSALE